jgi:phosphatidylglycerophosphate synthase
MSTLLKNVFLTREERENIAQWKYACVDHSITTKLFTPWWNFIVRFVPATVAPNILSLAGLICILYFFNLAFNYADEMPYACSFAGVILVFMYVSLDAIDGKHARNTGNSSPLGELFDHSCDNVSVPFLVMGFTLCMGITDTTINWYMVQTIQILFLLSHVDAFCKRVVEFGMFTGPGEALHLYLALLAANGFGFFAGFEEWFGALALSYDKTPTQLGILIFSSLYYISWVVFVIYVATMESKHNVTKKGLMVCILVRTIPALLIYWGLMSDKLR